MSEADDADALAHLVAAVQTSRKYRDVSAATIRRIGAAELAKRRSLKDAIKATKNTLHQIGGAYQPETTRYDVWLADLRRAQATEDPAALRAACRNIMQAHASTRERLPYLDAFYNAVFAGLPPVRSVLDLACGLNPLAIPWMPLAPGAAYHACDIYTGLADFLQGWLGLLSMPGNCFACDLIAACPPVAADLALLLKAIPCLEQLDKSIGRHLLDAIRAPHIAVSFPAQSLGGRRKGMPATYAAHFHDLIAGTGWTYREIAFPTELLYIVTKSLQANDH